MTTPCRGYPNRQERRHPTHGLPTIDGGHVPKTDGCGKWHCALCNRPLEFRRETPEGDETQ